MYDLPNFVRITSDKDSIKEMRVLSSHELRHQQDDEEYIRIFQDIYDNLGNLIYQVKINS